ncbi:tRNA(Ile)-lysidine synthase [Arcanobacterium wilhelmae]|uniref:tRNA(Ile)-lysidine synthase n=1 Tax=Arcanobacterium wilhelmae TaxID=1803177 RepID=A0ABT9NA77_9ACTO|nr:tRNA lysidine(34) synthetase TilS [Arcanobacterium wilhelmae]MDP9800618.1 tRNA(Ile)-lysidine synthase [Arcanobacterium wilhelmae]WFN90025.1 tRNA lysidine(34) synthetase TilS [Arcanobacterium wilhelmae]
MSFPAPQLTAVRHACATALEYAGAAVVLGVSGGSDSMALAAGMQWAAVRAGQRVLAVVVDHGLRCGSDAEAREVAEFLRKAGLEARTVSVDVGVGGGPEGAAREARYAALAAAAREVCPEKPTVFVAHHANDQAETVLLGLTRGSGATSLAGMRSVSSVPGAPGVALIRPLLHLRKRELEAAVEAAGWPTWEDPTNALDGPWRTATGEPLTRARIRHEILSALAELPGDVVGALARTARLLADDADALDTYAAQALADATCATGVVDARALTAYPRAVRTRALRLAALAAGARGGELRYVHIDALDALVTDPAGGKTVELPGARATKKAGRITFSPAVTLIK